MAVHIQYEGKNFQFEDGTSVDDAFAQAAEMYNSLPQSTPVEAPPRKSILDLMKEGNREELYQRGNPASLYDAAVGTAQELLDIGDKGKSRFESIDNRTKQGLNTSFLENLKGTGSAAADMAVGLPALIPAVGSGLIHGITQQDPVWGLKKGKEMMHTLSPSTYLMDKPEENPAYTAAMTPFAALTEALELSGKGYGEIAKTLGASETLQKQIAASMEGLLLTVPVAHGTKKAIEKFIETPTVTEIPKIQENIKNASLEDQLLAKTKQHIETELEKVVEVKKALEEELSTNPDKELALSLEKINELVSKYEQDKAEFEFATTGKHPLDVAQEASLRALEDVKPDEVIPSPTPEVLKPSEEVRPVSTEEFIRSALSPKLKDNSLVQTWAKSVIEDFDSGKASSHQEKLTSRMEEKFGKDFLLKTYKDIVDYLTDPVSWREIKKAEREQLQREYGDIEDKPSNYGVIEGPRLKKGSVGLNQSLQKNSSLVEDKIGKIQEQLAMDEAGTLPSGSLDKGLLEKQLEKLYTEHERLSETYQKSIIDARKEVPFDDSLPSIDSKFLDEQLAKKESIDEILKEDSSRYADLFIQHPEFFKSLDGIKVAKKLLDADPNLEATVKAFIHDLGLDKDNLYIVPRNPFSKHSNEIMFSGNTGIIHLDLGNHLELSKKFRELSSDLSIVNGLSIEAQQHYMTAKILAHELGHFVLVKWLKENNVTKETFLSVINDLNKWLVKNKIEPFTLQGLSNPQRYHQYHSAFHEYFAERVSNFLLSDGSIVNRFSKEPTNTLGKQITTLVSNVTAWLKKRGVNVARKYIHDDLIRDIISTNKDKIKQKAEDIVNQLEQKLIDKELLGNPEKYPFAHKTLEEVNTTEILDPTTGEIVPWHLDETGATPSINISTAALNVIGAGGKIKTQVNEGINFAIRKGFGKTTLSNILRKHFLVANVERSIREAEVRAARIGNTLWYGDVPKSQWETANIIQKFSKIKNPDSPYLVVKAMTNAESFRLHQVFEQGFQEGFKNPKITYDQILTQFGSHLTEKEKTYFKVLAKLFETQFQETQKLQISLGKKHVIKQRAGWYPAVRRGPYSVSLHYGASQVKVYQQHFGTSAAAEAFRKEAEGLGLLHFDVGEVVHHKNEAANMQLMHMIDVIEDVLPTNTFTASALARFKERLSQRGGKLGQHHEFRANIGGAKGDQFFKTTEELGAGFREAIQESVQEYTAGLRNMILKTKTERQIESAANHIDVNQEALAASRQMLDSALGRVVNEVEGIDQAVKNTFDKVGKGLVESFGGKFTPENPIYNTVQHVLLSTFYLFKVLPKVSLLVTQLLSPIQAVRHMAYDGGLRATKSFGKGLYNFISGNEELYQSLYRISQKTNVIEPQFMEALGLKSEAAAKSIPGLTVEFIKNWILLRKPTEITDIFSRAITYSMMYTHYRDLGFPIREAEFKAMHGTDSTMAAYSSGETAPMFKNLGGIVGESMRPLQTYGQTQVGNFIADWKHFQTKNPKTWAPLVAYGISATIMGGATTGVLLSQYEAVRLLLLKLAPSYSIPSILDIIRSMPNFLDGVVEDPDAQTKLLAYGVPSMTGMDIGASARIPETLPENLATVMLSILEGQSEYMKLFPAVKGAYDMASGVGTLTKKALGGDVTNNELKTALTGALPSGPIGWAAKEYAGVNTTTQLGSPTDNVAFGRDQEALMKRDTPTLVSNILGSKGTNERFLMDQNLQFDREEKILNDNKKRLATLWRDTGDNKYLEKMIVVHNMTKEQIETATEKQVWEANMPKHLRNIMNRNGEIADNPNNVRRAIKIFKFGTN